MPRRMSEIKTHEVSLVSRAANRRRFAVAKSLEHKMDPILEAVLGTAAEGEDQLIETWKSEGLDDKAMVARLAQHRLATGFADVLGEPDMKADKGYMQKLKGMMSKAKKGEMNKEDMKSMAEMFEEMMEKMETGPDKKSATESGSGEGVEAIVKSVMAQVAPVLKSKDDQISELSQTVKALLDSHKEDVFTAKARDSYRYVPGATEELAQVLKSAHDADPKLGETVETLLKRVNEAMASSGVFKSVGSPGFVSSEGGDAMSKISQLAKELVQKSDKPISDAKARAMVLKTAEGARLYDEYLRENPAQRAKTRDEYRR